MHQHTLFKYVSRLVAVLVLTLVLTVCFATIAHADSESGECGEKLTWSLSGGTLTISGSGAMTDYNMYNPAPWQELRGEIVRLELPKGLTTIGSMAFYECKNLAAVTIPNAVKTIGDFAFTGCEKMQILDLGQGVEVIGESAFADCYAVARLQLPDSLRKLGLKAFYRCESITTVTVPANVTSMDMMVFGYCKNLLTADVRAQITVIPEWLFYMCSKLVSVKLPDSAESINEFVFRGCEQLDTVYYDGEEKTAEEMEKIIAESLPDFNGSVTGGELPAGSMSAGAIVPNEDGSISTESTTVQQGQNSTVSTTVTNKMPADGGESEFSADIDVTVDNKDGWEEAQNAVNQAIRDYNSSTVGTQTQPPSITIYLKDGESVDKDFLNGLAGKDITINIVTQNGSGWRVNGQNIDPKSKAKTYDLTYDLTVGSADLCEKLGVNTCYVLRFHDSAEINAELMVGLGDHMALQNATLLKGKDFEQIQSSVVDQDGYAHFYLASVNKRSEYYIAINLPGAQGNAIVPDELTNAYGNPIFHGPIKYEITGQTSSWGMTFNQVTWIMVAVLVGCVVAVGAVMFALNKRKLSMGYIPSLDDEEE